MTVVAGAYTMKQHRTLLLHRTQTEEWKGWMQVGGRVLSPVLHVRAAMPRLCSDVARAGGVGRAGCSLGAPQRSL